MSNSAHLQTHETAEFSGIRALVTGGAKGIGAAVFKRLASAGAAVLKTSAASHQERVRHPLRNDPDSLSLLSQRIRDLQRFFQEG